MSDPNLKHLEDTLKNIGLNEKEAKVYLALLELGPSPVRDISLKSGLKKPTTYIILEELELKGAVIFIHGAKKKLFSAKDPDELFFHAKKRLSEALQNLPILQNLGKKGLDKEIVTNYKGVVGYEQAVRYREHEISEVGEILCYLPSAESLSPEMLASIHEHLNRLESQGVKVRAFSPQSPQPPNLSDSNNGMSKSDDSGTKPNRDMKILPPGMYSSHSSIEIGRTFVRFALFDQETTMIIENPEIAKVMRQIFEMNWGNVGFYQKMLGKSAGNTTTAPDINKKEDDNA